MPRVTSDLVKDRLKRDYDTRRNFSLDIEIRMASAMTDRVIACALKKDVVITDEEAYLIELNLAAHFYATSDRPYDQSDTDKAGATYSGKTDKGLDATLYGQSAKSVDPSGCLMELYDLIAQGERPPKVIASASWGGTRAGEQQTYDERNY